MLPDGSGNFSPGGQLAILPILTLVPGTVPAGNRKSNSNSSVSFFPLSPVKWAEAIPFISARSNKFGRTATSHRILPVPIGFVFKKGSAETEVPAVPVIIIEANPRHRCAFQRRPRCWQRKHWKISTVKISLAGRGSFSRICSLSRSVLNIVPAGVVGRVNCARDVMQKITSPSARVNPKAISGDAVSGWSRCPGNAQLPNSQTEFTLYGTRVSG